MANYCRYGTLPATRFFAQNILPLVEAQKSGG